MPLSSRLLNMAQISASPVQSQRPSPRGRLNRQAVSRFRCRPRVLFNPAFATLSAYVFCSYVARRLSDEPIFQHRSKRLARSPGPKPPGHRRLASFLASIATAALPTHWPTPDFLGLERVRWRLSPTFSGGCSRSAYTCSTNCTGVAQSPCTVLVTPAASGAAATRPPVGGAVRGASPSTA